MTSGPNYNEDPDTEGKAVPPYEGRRESADIEGQDASTREGARVGGATGPVEDSEQKAPDPESTERGEHASPADEQPATSTDGGGLENDPDATGPAHEPGTGRAEDKS